MKTKQGIVIIIVFSFVLTYISLIGISFSSAYKKTNNNEIIIEIEVTGEKNESALGSEMRVLDINIGGQQFNLEDFSEITSNAIYENGMLVVRHNKITIPSTELNKVKILFLKHPWSGIINVKIEALGINETIDLYSAFDDTIEFDYEWNSNELWKLSFKLNALDYRDIIFFGIIIFSIFCICLITITVFFKRILEDRLTLIHIVGMSISSFVICMLSLYVICKVTKIGGVLLILLGIFSFILFNSKYLENKIHYLYVIIYIGFATLMLFLLPPGHVPDEYAHYVKVYETSVMGDSHTILLEGKEGGYIYLPKAIEQLNNIFWANSSNYNVTYNMENYFYYEKLDFNDISENVFWFGNTENLNPTAYLVDILIQIIMNLVKMPPIVCIQIIRGIHALLYAIVGYLIIKNIPSYKRIFLIVFLLPIMVQQSFGINQDWMTNLVAFSIIAILVIVIEKEEKFERKYFLLLVILSFLLGNLKAGYFAVLFLIFAIPDNKFDNKKQKWIYIIGILLPCVLFTVITYITAAKTVVSNGILPYYEISFILQHPVKTMEIYINTFMESSFHLFINGLISGFGWYTHYAKNFLVSIAGVIFIILIFASNERVNKKFQIISGIAFGIICIFVFTSLFLGWTQIGSLMISGLQPRYFIIAMLCLAIAIQNKYLRFSVKYKNIFYALSSFFILCVGIFTIFEFYG